MKLTRIAMVLLLSVILVSVLACASTTTSKVYTGRVVWDTNSSPAAGTDVSISGVHVNTDSDGNYSVTINGSEVPHVLVAVNRNCYASMRVNNPGNVPDLRLVCLLPTPVRTPQNPPATGPWGPCIYWAGLWNTDWGVMDFVQTGFVVTATLENSSGLLVGLVREGEFTGVWYPDDASNSCNVTLHSSIYDNCDSFSGSWQSNSAGGGKGSLSGRRVNPNPIP